MSLLGSSREEGGHFMSEENKAVVRRFFEAINKQDLGRLDEFLAPNIVYHNAPPGLGSGIEGYRQMLSMYFAAFPDIELTLEDLIAEGDKVVGRITGRGTHQGDFMGITPTGKRVEATAISVMRLQGGRLTEEWEQIDMLGMLQQLGAVPAPGG